MPRKNRKSTSEEQSDSNDSDFTIENPTANKRPKIANASQNFFPQFNPLTMMNPYFQPQQQQQQMFGNQQFMMTPNIFAQANYRGGKMSACIGKSLKTLAPDLKDTLKKNMSNNFQNLASTEDCIKMGVPPDQVSTAQQYLKNAQRYQLRKNTQISKKSEESVLQKRAEKYNLKMEGNSKITYCPEKKFQTLVRLYGTSIADLPPDILSFIKETINESFDEDPTLYLTTLDKVKSSLTTKALAAFYQGRETGYSELVAELPPHGVISLAIACQKENPRVAENHKVLLDLVRDSVNQCEDYSFLLQDEYMPSALQIFTNLVKAIQNSKVQFTMGLVLFGVQVRAPHLIIQCVGTHESTPLAIVDALVCLKFAPEVAEIISKTPANIMYRSTLDFLEQKSSETQQDFTTLLTKLSCAGDPQPYLQDLYTLLQCKPLMVLLLAKKEPLKADIAFVCRILHRLKNFDLAMASKCLNEPTSEWERLSTSIVQLNQRSSRVACSSVQAKTLFEERSKNSNIYDQMLKVAEKLSEEEPRYQIMYYQIAIAAIQVFYRYESDKINLVQLPPASGKSWIMILIAAYYQEYDSSQKIAFITPNKTLTEQIENLASGILSNSEYLTIEAFYMLEKHQFTTCLLDEFHILIQSFQYGFVRNKDILNGLWNFNGSKIATFGFSGTIHRPISKFASDLMGPVNLQVFPSELEHLEGKVAQGHSIITFPSQEDIETHVIKEIVENYDKHPMIVFAYPSLKTKIQELVFKNLGWVYLDQSNYQTAASKTKAVMCLSVEDAAGIDSKFPVPAPVFVATEVADEAQFIQMKARSDRSEGNHIATLFTTKTTEEVEIDWKNTKYHILNSQLAVVKLLMNYDKITNIKAKKDVKSTIQFVRQFANVEQMHNKLPVSAMEQMAD